AATAAAAALAATAQRGRLLITADNPCALNAGRGRPARRRCDLGPARLRRRPAGVRRPPGFGGGGGGGGVPGLGGVGRTDSDANLAGGGRLRHGCPGSGRVRRPAGKAGPGLAGRAAAGQAGLRYLVRDRPSTGEVTTGRTQRRYDVVVEAVRSGLAVAGPESFFFPSAQVVVTNVRLRNAAAWRLPCGAVLSFASTDSLAMRKSETYHLAEAGAERAVHSDGPVHTAACLTCQLRTSRCATRAKRKSGRQSAWLAGSSPGWAPREQYCVNIEVSCLLLLVTLLVTNQSAFNFVAPEDAAAATTTCSCEVELRIRLDRRMLVAGRTDRQRRRDLGDPGYSGSSLPHAAEDKAELFDHVLCQVELYMHGKLVEYCSTTRCASRPTLWSVTRRRRAVRHGPRHTRSSFLQWQCLLETLHLDVDFWDTERYEGFSFFATHRPASRAGLRLDLAPHFTLAARLGDSAALLIAGDRAPLARLVASLAAEPAKPRLAYGCSGRLLHPLSCVGADREEAVREKRIRRILRDLNADSAASAAATSAAAVLYRRQDVEIRRVGCCRWSYGEAEFRRLACRGRPASPFWSCRTASRSSAARPPPSVPIACAVG
uniref:Protein kinase domain-containing protein n=1 Tax=Macrostomum lignano TaxID=282301 RepID=A0A1I8FPK5_9PLAT